MQVSVHADGESCRTVPAVCRSASGSGSRHTELLHSHTNVHTHTQTHCMTTKKLPLTNISRPTVLRLRLQDENSETVDQKYRFPTNILTWCHVIKLKIMSIIMNTVTFVLCPFGLEQMLKIYTNLISRLFD